ncbi:hypothetical protein [Rhizobium sp. Root1220]|uniref:hypothetical protein n=1 Tax=Rhizobium sp. Root1220 TaxID=1736432 RepID=UPI000A6D810B|nr:hypothetical protein [Rhizobium sp. Root1220]
MTYDIEIQIEELRAELRNACDVGDVGRSRPSWMPLRRSFAAAVALVNETVDREPPY